MPRHRGAASAAGLAACLAAGAAGQPCMPGSHRIWAFCGKCEAGTFTRGMDALFCDMCKPGTFAAESGASTCSKCPLGRFSDDFGAAECRECPGGRFGTDFGMTTCAQCPLGRFADASGATHCRTCAPGSFAATLGTVVCAHCLAGHFTNRTGAEDCWACPAGRFTADVGRTACGRCAQEFYAAGGADRCGSCEQGTAVNLQQTACYIPNKSTFMLAQAPINLGVATAMLTAVVLVLVHRHCCTKAPPNYRPLWEEQPVYRDAGSESRLWRVLRRCSPCCCLPARQPSQWSWWFLAMYDTGDWAAYTWWFLIGQPTTQHAQFEHDLLVAKLCCFIIFAVPVAPALVLILPRRPYLFIQLGIDALELLTVWYVHQYYSFSARSLLVTGLNYATTSFDVVVIKGPEALDSLFDEVPLLADTLEELTGGSPPSDPPSPAASGSPAGRPRGGHSPTGRSGRSPSSRSPGERGAAGRSPEGRSPGGRSPEGRMPAGH